MYRIVLFDLDGTVTDPGIGITNSVSYALENCQVKDLSEAVMIGDRNYDIYGAKENGIASIGVLFGYGSKEELESAGADYIAERVEDILKFL